MINRHPIGMPHPNDIPAPDYTALSHELRTPLAVISGYAQILQDELGADYETLTQPVVEQVQRLARVIDAVLETNELAAGRLSPTATSFPVLETLMAVVDRHTADAREKGVGLRVAVRLEADQAWTDAARITHALDAVLDNAIKFTESGIVDVHLESDDLRCVMTIMDDGPGFPQDNERIGSAFAQGSSGTARTHQGLGTGLFIARASMELVGGMLSFGNHPTGGAEVTLEWPLTLPATRRMSRAA